MDKIIKKLNRYLKESQISKLKIATGYTDNNISKLVVVMQVSDICREFKGSEKEEAIVSQLLIDLVESVFSPENN